MTHGSAAVWPGLHVGQTVRTTLKTVRTTATVKGHRVHAICTLVPLCGPHRCCPYTCPPIMQVDRLAAGEVDPPVDPTSWDCLVQRGLQCNCS